MAAGFGVLRLEPRAFWSMTVPELDAAIRGAAGFGAKSGGPTRQRLQTMMRLFPDETR
jgi:uncharacterized phage protein (TIGR02216 family)